jgi:hypothetical protein
MIFLDAVHVLRSNAFLLDRLEGFELSVLAFAVRKSILTIPMMERTVYLSSREKCWSPVLYRILKNCYEIRRDNDTLYAITLLLMKGERHDEESFGWYRKAVEAQLRITRLYEYYMISVQADEDGKVPFEINRMVLMYFSYQSSLDWQSNAILYRYIYEHRAEYTDLYDSYTHQIEKFVMDELDREHLSPAMGYLYQHVLTEKMIDAGNATSLLKILYMNRITVTDPSYAYVIIVYDKCRRTLRYPIRDMVADIPLYGSEYTILFSDMSGNILASSAVYQQKKLVPASDLARYTLPFIDTGDDNIDLFLYELSKNAYTINMDNASGYRKLADSSLIRQNVRADIQSGLIRFYYDNDFMRQLTEYLANMDADILDSRQRGEMLELLVLTGMYDKALEWLSHFGCSGTDPRILMRLCGRAFDPKDDASNRSYAEIAWYAFRRGKYDEATLMYLCAAFRGTVREMRDLYMAASSYGVDTWDLLSAIMIQLIYTGTYLGDTVKLYQDYVKSSPGTETELAFLALASYDYFVKNEITDNLYYDRIGNLYTFGTEIPEICMIAWLARKAETGTASLSVDERKIASEFLTELLSRKKVFGFYKAYTDICQAVQEYSDRTYLEYRTVPHSRCKVHYLLSSGREEENAEYLERDMQEMYDGLYVVDFVIFYGEQLQYYITEEAPGADREVKTDARSGLQLTQSGMPTGAADSVHLGVDGRYNLINDLLMADSVQDEKAVQKLTVEYFRNRFLCEELFRPVE